MKHTHLLTIVAASILSVGIQNNAHANKWLTTAELNSYIKTKTVNGTIPYKYNPQVTTSTTNQLRYTTDSNYKLVPVTNYFLKTKIDPTTNKRIPDVHFVTMSTGDDFVFLKGFVDKISLGRSEGQPTPESQALASCSTSQPEYTSVDSFGTSTAVGGLNSQSYASTKDNSKSDTVGDKFGQSIKGEISGEFLGVGLSVSGQLDTETSTAQTLAKSFGVTTTDLIQSNFNNISTYNKSWSVKDTVSAGAVGIRSFDTPIIRVTGTFHMARMLQARDYIFKIPNLADSNADISNSREVNDNTVKLSGIDPYTEPYNKTAAQILSKKYENTQFNYKDYVEVYSNTMTGAGLNIDSRRSSTVMMGPAYKSGWFQGTITMAQSNLPTNIKVPGETIVARPVYYTDAQTMTLAQYRKYCNGDIANKKYPVAMYPSLCWGGIDTKITCAK